MKKRILSLVYVLFFSAIPAILSYLANSDIVWCKLVDNHILSESINISLAQDYCLWVGIVVSAICLSYKLWIVGLRYNSALEQRNALIKMSKTLLTEALGKELISSASEFDIRIFVPKHKLLYKIAGALKVKNFRIFYIIKNVDIIADQGTTINLQFEVYPKPVGLVGSCYSTKAMVYDDNLEETNETKYKLDKHQVSRTSDLKWSICCPIFDEKNSVEAIMALDGKHKITIDKQKESLLRDHLLVYSRLLYDHVPQLFRRR